MQCLLSQAKKLCLLHSQSKRDLWKISSKGIIQWEILIGNKDLYFIKYYNISFAVEESKIQREYQIFRIIALLNDSVEMQTHTSVSWLSDPLFNPSCFLWNKSTRGKDLKVNTAGSVWWALQKRGQSLALYFQTRMKKARLVEKLMLWHMGSSWRN